jgi:hypothetical protein
MFGAGVALSADGADALVGGDEGDGQVWYFRASEVPGPFAATQGANSRSKESATLHASVLPNGHEITECVFEWGEEMPFLEGSAPCATAPGSGSTPVEVSAQISGLRAGETYLYRIRVANAVGTSYGTPRRFRAGAPTVVTREASEVTSSTATLNGTVNPNGIEVTECFFYLGGIMNGGFGQTVPCTSLPGSGDVPVAVSAHVDVGAEHPYLFRVVAVNASGSSVGEASGFLTEPFPSVTAISPLRGTAAGGTAVTISGNGFSGASEVLFGSTPAPSFEVTSPTTITAITPAAVGGKVHVSVTVEGATSPVVPAVHYKFIPQITGVSPGTGPAAGGTSVTITGAGFAPGGATAFAFGRNAASSVSCTSQTQCTALTTAHAAGRVGVTATVNQLSSPRSAAAKFSYAP